MAGQNTLSFLVIALFVTFAAAARLLDEEDTFPATTTPGSGPFPGPLPASGSISAGTGSGSAGTGFGAGTGSVPSGSGPTATSLGSVTGPVSSSGSVPLTTTGSGPLPTAGSVPGPLPVGPLPTVGSVAGPLPVGGGPGSLPATGPGPLPAAGSATGPGAGAGPALGGGAGAGPALGGGGAGAGPALGGGGGVGPDHTLVFFMHDILGGSNPTARAVTGVVANPALSGQLPFAKPNGANLPITNGVPSNNNNNGLVNNNNVPLLVGLGGNTANILQNDGNNNLLNGLPVANGGQLPSGSALQMLMFGTMTVIDDELTEGHELGSGLLGKAQGYYVASAVDGTSQTMAFTAMFESGGYEDSISFFGVHRTAASESHLGVMGGTGKYVNARGFAIVKTFTGSSGTQQQPHQFTDGLETVLQCTVYLSY
ncbi:Dirigent protein 10 [Hirschfeldia incana]|nr:Dirigent protein 10 [Hirschfeldia incana]